MDSSNHKSINPINKAEEEEAFLFAMQLASGSVLPMVLKSAIELNLLELMAEAGPAGTYLSPSQLVAQLPHCTNPNAANMIDRILRLLSCYSVLNCTLKTLPDCSVNERHYSLALPVCKYLTKNADGLSLAPLLLMNQDKVFMETWYHLSDAVLNGGIPFKMAYGMSASEYHGTDPRFSKVLNLGMSNHSTITMNKILEDYKGFEGISSIVDVGGGAGATLNAIVSKYPTIKGINFDLPHVIKGAPSYPGVEHIGGDMFVSIPKGDAIFMKWIVHGWSDEHCLKFLKNCYEALPENGKVIVADCILSVATDTSLETKNVVRGDVMMLAYSRCGKERTEKEFEALAKGVGFREFHKACCAFGIWIMEFYK